MKQVEINGYRAEIYGSTDDGLIDNMIHLREIRSFIGTPEEIHIPLETLQQIIQDLEK